MKFSKDLNILIIGLGLMGGSYASALSKKGYKVNAITLDQESIDYAMNKGWIEKGSAQLDEEMLENADITICALYPTVFIDWIEKNQHLLKSGSILTDITGVKEAVVDRVQGMLRPDVEFISAHPMAGREASGITHSDDSVFNGANYIVVPTDKNTPEAIQLCKELGEALGFSKISELDAKTHDTMIAFLSQLTHVIAVALMCATDDPSLEKYTGDSFRDLTRIAKINDEMWSELFLINKETLLSQMQKFREAFDALEETLINDDREEMRRMMRLSTERRSLFDKKE